MVIAKAFPAFVKWCRSKSSGWSRSGPKHEHEFLPAALEILETPPSPTGRMVALLLCCLFLIALVWSFLGRIDVNATASAQLVPIGGVKTIQSLETAVVRRILVDNGQTVVKGDLLVELDTTENATDISQLRNERARAKEDFYRYAAFLAEIADDSLALGASENAVLDTLAGQVRNGKSGAHGISPSDDASMIGSLPDKQKRLLLAKLAAYQAKRTSLDAQIRESDAVIRSSRHEVRSLRNRLALLETKASALKKMVDRHGDAR
ncbi:MAG: biotin/lipoyl-binding protein, partial [Burkholderiaceae bacterium]|nr:biotin/lipoyl-binding protein [Burkholderiaceae bacterium]